MGLRILLQNLGPLGVLPQRAQLWLLRVIMPDQWLVLFFHSLFLVVRREIRRQQDLVEIVFVLCLGRFLLFGLDALEVLFVNLVGLFHACFLVQPHCEGNSSRLAGLLDLRNRHHIDDERLAASAYLSLLLACIASLLDFIHKLFFLFLSFILPFSKHSVLLCFVLFNKSFLGLLICFFCDLLLNQFIEHF